MNDGVEEAGESSSVSKEAIQYINLLLAGNRELMRCEQQSAAAIEGIRAQ